MSQSKETFNYSAEYARNLKTLSANEQGDSVRISINDFRPGKWESGDITLRVRLPKEEIPAFIEFLQEIVRDET